MIIKLCKEIYSKAAVEQAIQDYALLADVQLSETDTHFVCQFLRTTYDATITANEFENYIIDLCNQKS